MRRSQADEEKLRAIGMQLVDTRARLREQRDSFDLKILALENEDAKAGNAPNDFDARVLRLLRD